VSGVQAGGGAPTTPGTTTAEGCKPGIACNSCINCISVTDICKESPCMVTSSLAQKLRTALSGQNARITEGWPPTVNHASSCHKNGLCADVNLTTNKGDVNSVKSLYNALTSAGLGSLTYESNNCAPYTAVGVPCHYYATMTYPSFHVNN
jgi:hypothetical protein